MWRADSLEKTLMLRKLRAGGERVTENDGWMPSPTQWTWVWANSGRWGRTENAGVLQSMGSQSRTRLSDWTELKCWQWDHFPWIRLPLCAHRRFSSSSPSVFPGWRAILRQSSVDFLGKSCKVSALTEISIPPPSLTPLSAEDLPLGVCGSWTAPRTRLKWGSISFSLLCRISHTNSRNICGRVRRNIYARLPRKAFDCNGLESRILDTFQGVPLILDHLQQWCRAMASLVSTVSMVSLKFFQ